MERPTSFYCPFTGRRLNRSPLSWKLRFPSSLANLMKQTSLPTVSPKFRVLDQTKLCHMPFQTRSSTGYFSAFSRVVPIISAGKNTTDIYQHTGYMQRMFEVKNSGDTTIIITIFSVPVWHIDVRRRQRVANFCLGMSMNLHNFIFLGILSCSSN